MLCVYEHSAQHFVTIVVSSSLYYPCSILRTGVCVCEDISVGWLLVDSGQGEKMWITTECVTKIIDNETKTIFTPKTNAHPKLIIRILFGIQACFTWTNGSRKYFKYCSLPTNSNGLYNVKLLYTFNELNEYELHIVEYSEMFLFCTKHFLINSGHCSYTCLIRMLFGV